MMNQKLSLSQRGIAHVLAIVIGLGLLAALALSLNALFASRSQQTSRVAKQPEVEKQADKDVGEPSSSPTVDTDQADPTMNWETYEDTTLGFSFKHPADCRIFSGNQHDPVLPANTLNVVCDKTGVGLEIVPLPRRPNTSLSNALKDFIATKFGKDHETEPQPVGVAGTQGIRATLHQQGPAYALPDAFIFHAFETDKAVYVVITGYPERDQTGTPADSTGERKLQFYHHVLGSLQLK